MKKYTQEDLDALLAAPKWVVLRGELLDVQPLGNATPLHHRLTLQDQDGDNRFLWEINQSPKNMLKLTLHHQQSDTCEPLLRVDYQSGHMNPVEILPSLPARFHPYAGKEFSHQDHHIHYPVQGYKPLAWAIPLANHDFPVKELTPTAELGNEIVRAISAFASIIQLRTRIHIEPMLVV